ncbi:MAG: cation:proton antiporter [Bacteriovoracia bacterium]
MTSLATGSLVFHLCLLLLAVHGVGFLFEKWRQPKLLGEILVGVLFGPHVLAPVLPALASEGATVLSFISQAGLILLMFLAGTESKHIGFQRNKKLMLSLVTLGTGLPFLLLIALASADLVPLTSIMGSAQSPDATLTLLAIAVTVTSIPVLSRIFQDLRLTQTQFAALIIGTAVLEDILLWGVLSFAQVVALKASSPLSIALHMATNLLFMAAGLLLLPAGVTRLASARGNFVARNSPIAWPIVVLLSYISLAHLLQVNVVFAAFLAGFALTGGASSESSGTSLTSVAALRSVAQAFFIPLFFAMIGYKLKLDASFSARELCVFLLGSSALSSACTWFAARVGGLRAYEALNVAITSNARGGPGIVLAGIAFESGLVTASFYTTLVLTALLTSLSAAWWLRFQVKRRRPLLSGDSLPAL